ncbi:MULTISPECIES: hypothetical protein [Rhodobacterales]|uniref:hypothetical protein n=1 Tax=Rhodobacterales TaxID=204455 RepID=UPI003298F134
MTHWTLILIAACANVALNLFLRQTGRGLNTGSLGEIILSLLVSPWAWLSVMSAAVLLGAFVAAIRVYSLSLTYAAVTSIAMVALTVVGVVWHMEVLSTTRVLGLGLIISGILLSAFA